MKNIWKIFQRDLQQIQKNVIAMIVIIGITVVPCLYAWFNIAASWDPYENTGNLKVAVASVDEGYEGSIIPVQLTLGDQVLSALREKYAAGMGIYHKIQSHERCKIRQILCSHRHSRRLQPEYDERIHQ